MSSAVALDQGDIAKGFEQTPVIIAVEVATQHAGLAPLIDRGGRYAELLGKFFGSEHATLAQTLKPALQLVGIIARPRTDWQGLPARRTASSVHM